MDEQLALVKRSLRKICERGKDVEDMCQISDLHIENFRGELNEVHTLCSQLKNQTQRMDDKLSVVESNNPDSERHKR